MRRTEAGSPPVSSGGHDPYPDYRPDIDGLRALAIVAVVAFHVLPQQIPGGFLGVDVFFVISGFLISTIIFEGLAAQRFSFAVFYARRVRRVFPALIVVVAFCCAVGWNALLPSEFILLGKHVRASMGFYENIVLRREAGYFDLGTSLKPLMHVWSLSVEEQFYLVFPLLMWGARRLRLNLLAVLAAIFGVSFAIYARWVSSDPVSAFFSPYARFWELMTGAMLAYLTLRHCETLDVVRSFGLSRRRTDRGRRSTANVQVTAALISLAALAILAWVIFGIDRYVPAPRFSGEVLAVSGAALLIFSGQESWLNRILLANRAAVFVGLISYPLYLWHWPLLSFLTIVDGKDPEPWQRLTAVLVSIVLAILTYRFVELPIRRSTPRRAKIAAGLAAAAASLLLLGIFARHVAPRYDAAISKIIAAWDFTGYPDPPNAVIDKDYSSADGRYRSVAFAGDAHNRVAVLGDSHAEQYKAAVEALRQRSGADASVVPQVLFVDDPMGNLTPEPRVLATMIADRAISTAILSEFWATRYNSPKINYVIRCCGDALMGTVGGSAPLPLSPAEVETKNENFKNLIVALKAAGKQVYVILDNPFGEELAPRSLLERSFFHRIEMAKVPVLTKSEFIERDEPTRSQIENIALAAGAKIIDPLDDLCDQTACLPLTADGYPIYKDYDHLSIYALAHRIHYLDFILQQQSATE
jgi:peptidoglycan/LPS O-acetylase OafA/YrhL